MGVMAGIGGSAIFAFPDYNYAGIPTKTVDKSP